LDSFTIGSNPGNSRSWIALGNARQIKVGAFINLHVLRGRLEDKRLAVNVQESSERHFLCAGIGQKAGQVADIVSIQGVEVQVPVVAVELMLGPQSLYGVVELEDLIVSCQIEHFAVVLTLQPPGYTLAVLRRQLHNCTLSGHRFAGSWHDRIEYDSVLVFQVKARNDLGIAFISK